MSVIHNTALISNLQPHQALTGLPPTRSAAGLLLLYKLQHKLLQVGDDQFQPFCELFYMTIIIKQSCMISSGGYSNISISLPFLNLNPVFLIISIINIRTFQEQLLFTTFLSHFCNFYFLSINPFWKDANKKIFCCIWSKNEIPTIFLSSKQRLPSKNMLRQGKF